jgi:2'-5' RNA ligase
MIYQEIYLNLAILTINMENKMIRAFIALNLSSDIIDEIIRVQGELKDKNLIHAKYTKHENLHLTLKFLGEIDEQKVEVVREKLALVNAKQFQVTVSQLGIFSEKFIRIVWVKLDSEELIELQKKIDNSLDNLFPKERQFMGHITIARVKDVKDKASLLNYLKNNKMNMIKGNITSFSLMKSTLTPKGPIYEVIERYGLS